MAGIALAPVEGLAPSLLKLIQGGRKAILVVQRFPSPRSALSVGGGKVL